MAYQLIGYAVFLPLAGFLFNGIFGRSLKSEKIVGWVASAAVGAGFLVACIVFWQMLRGSPEERVHHITLLPWISAGGVSVGFSYQIDQLSILMMLIVIGVGFLIHVYSIGYMHGDGGFWRFFAYLNLFIFAMLTLVMADNFLLLFLGWEGVDSAHTC